MSKSLSFTRITKLIKSGNMDEAYHTPNTIKNLKKICDDYNKIIGRKIYSYKHSQKMVNDICYVNSWTKGDKESKYMWKKYAPDGVIIKSTVDKLEKATTNNRFRVYCKDVIYNDDNTIQFPQPLFISRTIKSIKNIKDNEFRALMVAEKQGDYIDIHVNLNDLITGVIVHHNNDLETVQKLLDNNNVNVKATRSQLTGS
jgi:hypothetical protein